MSAAAAPDDPTPPPGFALPPPRLTRETLLRYETKWFASIEEFAPELPIRETGDGPDAVPTAPPVLVFITEDGSHARGYVLTRETRDWLLRCLTGGVILARPSDVPPPPPS